MYDPSTISPDESAELRRLIRSLPAADPVRCAVICALDNEPPPVDRAPALLQALRDRSIRRWRRRAAAAWVLGVLPPDEEATSALAEVLFEPWRCTDGRYQHRFHRAVVRCWRFGLALGLPLGILIALTYLPGRNTVHSAAEDLEWWPLFTRLVVATQAAGLIAAVVMIMATPFIVPLSFTLDNRARAMAARSLGRKRAIARAGELANAVLDPSPSVHKDARLALIRVLEVCSSSNRASMDNSTLDILHSLLERDDEELVLTVVRGLGRFGTGYSIAPIERACRHGCTPPVRAAANQVLATVLEVQKKEAESNRLLRAADVPDTLLRPAAAGITPAELLLRAGDAKEA